MLYTLYDRLKPGFLDKLKQESEDGYGIVEDTIIPFLKENKFFDDLTVFEVKTLKYFTESFDITQYDVLYGSKWFYTHEEYKSLTRDTEDNITE